MNFSDLLDEDGQGTRELDAWLAENIENEQTEWIDAPLQEGELLAYSKYSTEHHIEDVEFYTTGDSIDPIWGLAKEYAQENFDYGILYLTTDIESGLNESFLPSNNVTDWHDTEQLAIAEALFKAYQKKEDDE